MYKQILESIDGIGIYPIVTLIMFFVFFIVMILWLFNMDKTYLKNMAKMPLDQNEVSKKFKGNMNE